MKKVILIGTTILSLNASNLTDSLVEGQIGATVSFWYQTTDDKKPYWQNTTTDKNFFSQENSIANGGLEASYLSKELNGLSFGVKFYLLDSLNLHQSFVSSTPNGTLGVNSTATWLGEGYLKYSYGASNFKLGRQNINSPLINSDTWSIHPNNFEGFSFYDETLENVKLLGGIITKERVYDKEEFEDFMKFTGVKSTRTLFGGVVYDIDDIVFKAFYYSVKDITNAIYSDVTYNYQIFNVSAQVISMMPDVALQKRYQNGDNTVSFGFKTGFIYDIFDFSIAYSQTSKKGFMPISNMADYMQKSPIYTATISGDSDIAGVSDTKGYKASLRAKISNQFTTILNWGYYEHGKEANYFGDYQGAEDDSLTAELILRYNYDQNIDLFLAYLFTDEAKGKFYNDSENVNSIRAWAKYSF